MIKGHIVFIRAGFAEVMSPIAASFSVFSQFLVRQGSS